MFLVVGLGNPGEEYASHRHNVGFMVLDELCGRWRIGPLKQKFGGEQAKGTIHEREVIALRPLRYMNVSGEAVQAAASFFQIEPRDVIVIHDDIDLEFGRLKVKVGGGHGGHNGVRSISEHLGPAFLRVRVGVGHPGHKERVIGHVLGPFTKAEQKELGPMVANAADAVETLIKEGAAFAMNKFNQGPKEDPI